MKLWLNWESIDSDKNIKSYIFTIAKHTIYNKLKSFVVQQTYLNDVFYNYSIESNAVEELVHYKELKGIYDQAVEKLPSQRQRIFRLSREENLSHEEIAEQLHISKNTVKDQMVKSLKFIRHYLEVNANLTSLLLVFYHYIQKK
ncbi:RNA polymerase sigma factor [compost metagenome]